MKKILFVQNTSAIGGASFCMLNIIKELDYSIFDITVAVPDNGPLVKELTKIGVEVKIIKRLRGIPYNRSLMSFKFLLSYVLAFLSCFAFWRVIRRNHYEVIYLNSMVLYPLLLPSRLNGSRTIIHVREHWPLNEHAFQLGLARLFVNKLSHNVFAINHYSASIFPGSLSKCSIVYDWIDMDSRYEDRPYTDIFGPEAAQFKVFLYTGGFDQFKGPKEVVTVFSQMVKDPNARLLIMGELPNNPSTPYIKDTIELIRQDNRIVCIPRTYNISHIIEQAYCVLSYFTIPHANLGMAENIIMNTVTIAADNEEAREYSDNGQLALLFKANSMESMSNQVAAIESNYVDIKNRLLMHSSKIKSMFNKQLNFGVINDVLTKI